MHVSIGVNYVLHLIGILFTVTGNDLCYTHFQLLQVTVSLGAYDGSAYDGKPVFPSTKGEYCWI